MVLGRSLEEVRQVQVQFLGGCPVLPTDQAPSSMEHAPSSPGITPQEERRLCLALEWRYPRLGDVTRVQITPAERRVAEVAMGAHSRMVQANEGLVDRQSISDGRSTRQSSSSDGVTDSWRCSVQDPEAARHPALGYIVQTKVKISTLNLDIIMVLNISEIFYFYTERKKFTFTYPKMT